MKLKKLDIRNLGVFEQTTFEFDEKFTLLVGVNGSGKTMVIDTLRVCLSHVLHICMRGNDSQIVQFAGNPIAFGKSNSNIDLEISSQNSLSHLNLSFSHNDRKCEKSKKNKDLEPIRQRMMFSNSKPIEKLFNIRACAPICVYFSITRSSLSRNTRKKKSALLGQDLAHVDSLLQQPTSLADLAAWLHAQLNLPNNALRSKVHPEALQKITKRFLPRYKNLQATAGNDPTFTVEKDGCALDVRQLSKGERGVIALVLDIARRLWLANPSLKDPIGEGRGIVLIDEIDLHLHPKWQRDLVGKLCKTFPNCQFVATTHSPQVIGEVEASKIRVIQDGNVSLPVRSFGVDTNRLLADLMGTPPRKWEVQEKIRHMSALVDEERYEEALKAIEELETLLGESDPETTRARTLICLLEDDM